MCSLASRTSVRNILSAIGAEVANRSRASHTSPKEPVPSRRSSTKGDAPTALRARGSCTKAWYLLFEMRLHSLALSVSLALFEHSARGDQRVAVGDRAQVLLLELTHGAGGARMFDIAAGVLTSSTS